MKANLKFILPIAVSFVLPAIFYSSQFYTLILTLVLLNCIIAIAFDLLAGYAGLDNLAIAGLASIGGYTMAYLVTKEGLNFFITLPLAGVAAGVLGLALVYPSLRIKGVYFAISTIMVQLLLYQLFNDWVGFTGGNEGIYGIPMPSFSIGGTSFHVTGTSFAYLSLVALVVWLFVFRRITSGRSGLKLISIRDDDVLASHLGINLTRQRLIVFFISSFVAGIYGALATPLTTYINPDIMNIFFSFDILLMVYLGGRATTWGPIIGAAILTILPNAFTVLYTLREFVTGLLLIVVILVLPGGLYSVVGRIRERRKVIGAKTRPVPVSAPA